MAEHRDGWTIIGNLVALAVSLGTAAAGALLIVPDAIPVVIAIESGRYIVFGFFLLYSAFLIAVAALAPARQLKNWFLDLIQFTFGVFALFATGAIEIVLAGRALFVHPINLWVLLLVIPGAASSILALSQLSAMQTSAMRSATKPQKELQELLRKAGQIHPKAEFLASIRSSATYAIQGGLTVSSTLLGFFAYFVLNDLLFNEVRMSMDHFMRVAHASFPLMALMLFSFVIFFIVPVLFQFPFVFFRWLSLFGHRDANRDLTDRDIAFIKKSFDAAVDYATKRGYGERSISLIYVTTISYLIFAGLCIWGFIEIFYPAGTPPAHIVSGLYLYIAPECGPSGLLFALAVLIAIPLPCIVVSCLSRSYAERFILGQLGILGGRLIYFVRLRRLDTSKVFDPVSYIRRAGFSFTRNLLIPLALVLVATAWLWPHDKSNFAVFTDREIEVADYWSQARIHYSYSAVVNVNLFCSYKVNGGLDYSYTINFPDDRSVQLMRPQYGDRNIAAYAAIDTLLRRRHAPFKQPISGFHPGCVRDLAGEFSGEDLKRVERLFHLDEWQKRASQH